MLAKDKQIYQKNILLFRAENSYSATLCMANKTYEALTHDTLLFLHPSEQKYYQTLAHHKRQYSYLLGRYCAKQALLMEPFNINPSDCAILPGVFGQPVVISWLSNVQVCIAHCDSLGIALAYPEAHPIGVDIEKIDIKNTPVIKEQMTRTELTRLAHALNNETFAATLLWTAKEALSKIMRTGLMTPFSVLEISETWQEGGFIYSKFKNFHQYQACSFMMADYYVSIVYPHQTKLELDLEAIASMACFIS